MLRTLHFSRTRVRVATTGLSTNRLPHQPHRLVPQQIASWRTATPSILLAALSFRRPLSTVASELGNEEEVDELKGWLSSFNRDAIPYHSFTVHHARSSGAGGQNVNKGQSVGSRRAQRRPRLNPRSR